jgi:3-hydroxyisobutyrate dehydrogenase
MRVSVLGTGIMGFPMARNIAAAGHEVRAWNRSRERAEELGEHGVTVCDSAQEAVDGAEVVVTMLADGDAVADVAERIEFPAGAVWAQMSTVGIEATDRLLAVAERAGVPLVDAPVTGTKAPAEQGKLTVLASGDRAARERCAPVFDAVGAATIDLGDKPGAATRMKLVLNAWLVSLIEGLAESIALAEGLGLDPAQFIDIIDGGPLGPPYAKMKGTMMIERSYEPSFSLALAAKDARLVDEAARAAGLDLPLPRTIAEQMQRGVEAGHGEEDMSATVRTARSKSA